MVAACTWFYEVGAEFLPFSESCSEELERLYNAWQENSFNCQGGHVEVRSGKYTYTVDFSQMHQQNSKTGKRRQVKRDASDRDRKVTELLEQYSATETANANLRNTNARLESELALLKEKLSTMEAEMSKRQGVHNELRQSYTLLQSQEASKQRMIERHVAESRKLCSELDASQKKLERAVREQSELERALTSLRSLHADLQAEHAKLQTQCSELQLARNHAAKRQEAAAASLQQVWQFRTHFHTWQTFDANVSDQIATMYHSWISEHQQEERLGVFQIDDDTDIDFNEMVQRSSLTEEMVKIRCMTTLTDHLATDLHVGEVVEALHHYLQQKHLEVQRSIQLDLASQSERSRQLEHQLEVMSRKMNEVEQERQTATQAMQTSLQTVERQNRTMEEYRIKLEEHSWKIELTSQALDELHRKAEADMEKMADHTRAVLTKTFLRSSGLAAEEQAWHLRRIVREFGGTTDDPIAMAEAFRQRSLTMTSQDASRRLSHVMTSLLSDLPPQPPDMARVALFPGIFDYELLKHMFLTSLRYHRLQKSSDIWCHKADLEVVSITAVRITSDMYRRYTNRCQQLAQESGLLGFDPPFGNVPVWQPHTVNGDAKEFFMFHGTNWANVDSICSRGFDVHKAGEKGGAAFGKAVYFAPHASKSDQYSDKDSDGQKCIFMARVALGRCMPRWKYCSKITSPPDGFDSIAGLSKKFMGCVDHPEVAVFQEEACLPLFKIIYRHQPTCRCYLCSRD